VLTSTFDRAGWRNALKLAGSWGTRDLGFGHDALLRFSNLKDHRGLWTSIKYNRDQLPATVTFPTGSTKLEERFTYTPGHLPAGIGFNVGGVELPLGRRYTYDILDRITTARRGQDPTDLLDGDVVKRYVKYDALGRLSRYDDVHEWQEEGEIVCPDPFDLESCYRERISHSDTLRTDAFTYDKIGNRTDKGAVLETGNRLTAFNGFTLQYDADGNLTRKVKSGVADYSFTWNSLGQLVEVMDNSSSVLTEFGYDGFGRRARKTSWVGTTPSTTHYLWDGDDLVAELDGAGNPIREYAYYPGIDRPHSVRRASDGAVFYYMGESPGHVTGLVSATNQVLNKYEYTPWGEPITTSEQVAQPLRYMAREYDGEAKLFYVRARYYDPALGRFISEDPIGLAGGLNPFAYVANDPVNFTDPSGLGALCASGETAQVVQVDVNPDGGVTIYYFCVPAGGFSLNPVTVTAWPFATPRNQGANANPSSRGDLSPWQRAGFMYGTGIMGYYANQSPPVTNAQQQFLTMWMGQNDIALGLAAQCTPSHIAEKAGQGLVSGMALGAIYGALRGSSAPGPGTVVGAVGGALWDAGFECYYFGP
jgi:RHS repeat-associated protein